ncbi:hypothetical protein D3C84_790680 [compost metagenome]
MIGAEVDGFLHHLVTGLQAPHAVLAAGETGRCTQRQLYAELVVTLVVVEFDDVDLQAVVVAEAVPDADFGQQPFDERQVAFAVLHDLLAAGVFTHQLEQEVLAKKVVATAQDVLDDLRDRLLLVQAVLAAVCE